MIEEHQRVILTNDLTAVGLKAGDVGTVIHVHRGGKACEVEFLTLHGETAAIATVDASYIRPVTQRDMIHARLIKHPHSRQFWSSPRTRAPLWFFTGLRVQAGGTEGGYLAKVAGNIRTLVEFLLSYKQMVCHGVC